MGRRPGEVRVLILSGGSAGLFAFGGALRALEEAGWIPDRIAGTSAGALAGALFAARRTHRIRELAGCLSADDLWGSDRPFPLLRRIHRLKTTRGLLDPSRLRQLIEEELPDDILAVLPQEKLEVYTVDLLSGRPLSFHSTSSLIPFRDALLGSSSLPPVLPPHRVTVRGRCWELRDGGILSNHPTLSALVAHRTWKARPEAPFQCLVLSALDPYPQGDLPGGWAGVVEEINRAVALMLHQQAHAAREMLERHKVPFRWRTLPSVIDLLTFTTEDAERVEEEGYRSMTAALHGLRV